MAAPTKKRAVPENMVNLENEEEFDEDDDIEELEDDAVEVEDDEDDDEEFMDQEVNVEFEARNLEDCDFHGIRKLLSQLFLKANIDLSELSDTLISQNYVGSAIKQVEVDEEDSDDNMAMDENDDNQVFGIISLVNLTQRKELNCVKQLKSVLLEKCAKCDNKAKLADVLTDDTRHLGLILNERFINIPPQIAVPSFESLWNEVDRANKKKMPYDCSHYLMVTKICKLSVTTPGNHSSEISTYINAEEELFKEAADFSCEYSVKEERDMATQGDNWEDEEDEMEPYREVLVIPSHRVPDVMAKLKEAYG